MESILYLTLAALAVAFVSGAATPSAKDKVLAVSHKCAAAHKTSADQTKLAFNQEIPKDETERCFLDCVFSGVGVIHDGSFSLDGSMKLVALRFPEPNEKKIATSLVETCAKEIKKGGEKCHLGQAVRECFVKHGKTVNFFPSAA